MFSGDFFRELTVVLRLSRGELLYRDIHHDGFGPLMPYIGALVVLLLGLKGMVWLALTLQLSIIACMGWVTTRWNNVLLSFSFMLLVICVYLTNGPIMFPYAFSSVAEIVAVLVLVGILDRRDCSRPFKGGLAAGAALAAAFLIRPHSSAIYALAVFALLCWEQRWRYCLGCALSLAVIGMTTITWLLVTNAFGSCWMNLTGDFILHGMHEAKGDGHFSSVLTYSDRSLVGIEYSSHVLFGLLSGGAGVLAIVICLRRKLPVVSGALISATTLPLMYSAAAVVRRFAPLALGIVALVSLWNTRWWSIFRHVCAAVGIVYCLFFLLPNRVEYYRAYNIPVVVGGMELCAPRAYKERVETYTEMVCILERLRPEIESSDAMLCVGKYAQAGVIEFVKPQMSPVTSYAYNLFHDTDVMDQTIRKIESQSSLAVIVHLDPGYLQWAAITADDFWASSIGQWIRANCRMLHESGDSNVFVGISKKHSS